MYKSVALVSLLILVAACTDGEDGQMMMETPPSDTMDETPPSPPPSPPPTPPETNAAPVITTGTITGQEGVPLDARLRATDSEGDTVSFALIDGPKWLSIGPSGIVSGTPGGTDIGDAPITVAASDGTDRVEAEIDLDIAYDPIEQALRTGDYTIITDETELTPPQALLEDLDRIRTQNNADLAAIFKLDGDFQVNNDSLTNVSWQYGARAVFYAPTYGGSVPLIYASGGAQNSPATIATIGRHEAGRFAMLGENPFRLAALDDTAINQDMQSVLENLIAWLIDADPEDGVNIVLAHLPETNTFPDESSTRDWLSAAFGDAVSYNAPGSCDGFLFNGCLTSSVRLIIVSQEISSTDDASAITERIDQALSEGIAVLYVHSRTNVNAIESGLLDLFNLGDGARNTAGLRTTGFSPVGVLEDWQPTDVTALESLVDRMERDDLEYDLSPCDQYWQCSENPVFAQGVTSHLQGFHDQLDTLNERPGGAFPVSNGQRWLGFLVLAGDYYRSLTRYPMTKTGSTSGDIIRAMFGDLSTIISRKINPASNLGSFGRSAFPDHLRTNKSVEMTTQRPFRTTGAYAIPGETVTVTRTDDSNVSVSLKVHSVRERASAPFRTTYDRPLILSSRRLTIEPGETLTITSATGGPIHAFFEVTGEDISFDFENVGEHPVYRGPEDTSTFMNALAANAYDWAEFVTPYFEVHSTRAKMLQTLNRPYASSPGNLSNMIDTYIRDWPHWFAGLEGPDISPNADLRAFANRHGLSISTIDAVKHMNADRPACNNSAPNCSGTSGNPYDAEWFFDPIYLGDLHELGHGLEFRARHHFEGGDNIHSTTNLYSFHTSYRYFQATGDTNFTCWSLPYASLYTTIQQSQLRSDPGQYMRDADLSMFNEQMAMFVQLLAALETQGVLDDGWLMMPRLNLVTREFQNSNNDATWAAKASGLGFGGMDRQTAFSLSQNDWLLIALSWSAQRDLRDYLDMWGYIYSEDALDHVASLGLPRLRPAYYGIDSRGHCFGLTHNELPIDGRTSFSTSSASAKIAPFTPAYLKFSEHTHSEMCSLGDHVDGPN